MLYKNIVNFASKIPNYALKNQTERAALSIVLNIAEGSGKKSDTDFARFLQISLGSVNELVACIDLMREFNFIKSYESNNFVAECEDIARQLGGFAKKLRNDP